MAKTLTLSRGLGSILFWSVISAAFIGPGTVTTTAKAGSTFGLGLLWALIFSIFGTYIMQEAAARVTLASGKTLGEVLALRYGSRPWIRWVLFLAVWLGCMAYQAGNLLGAMAGLSLMGFSAGAGPAALLVGFAALVLSLGKISRVARLMGLVVAIMGIAFLLLAVQSGWQSSGTLGSPSEKNWLALGLIGTTLVPYNLFLASGISKGQPLKEMRFGLAGAIGIGGLISIAIMVVATRLETPFSFQGLGSSLREQYGPAGNYLFAFGLFAAGFTSSVTAPLAAAVTGQSLLGERWKRGQWRFSLVWVVVLLFGLLFVWLDVQPIPAIVAAQGVNGLLLPVIGFFLFFAMNDKRLLPEARRNSWLQNVLLLLVVLVVCGLGLNQLVQAGLKIIG